MGIRVYGGGIFNYSGVTMFDFTTIEKGSHYVAIKKPTPAIIKALYRLGSEYTQFGHVTENKRKKWAPIKTFVVYSHGGREFRIHNGQFKRLMEIMVMMYVPITSYEIVERPMYDGDDIDINILPEFKLRGQQPEAVQFIDEGGVSPLLKVPMGGGKTLMSLYAAAKRKKRIAIVVLAGFVDKWVGDLQKCTDIQLNEICVVSGSDGLERSSNYPGSGLAMPKAFVISLNSVGRWLTNHEAQPDDGPLPGFSSSPDKYFEHLGVGTIIFDEVHMHPHAIYRIFSYVHVPKTIALTATLETKDPVLRKVQSTMFPKSERFDEIKMKQYIDVVACNYQIAELGRTKIRTSEYGSNSYSQTAFEKSIISDRVVYPQYMKMVIDLIRESYIDKRETGDKLIVFTGTKEMATRLLETSKRLWSTLDIRTYLEGDPFENVIVPDIRFTTVIGGGTAIDIPQLTVAIMTNSIDSPNANLQTLGRLREIPGKATTFYYLYSPTLKKQKDYHESKKTLFTGRVKSHGEKMLPAIMGKPPEYERFRQHH